jgi:hypothetical protein
MKKLNIGICSTIKHVGESLRSFVEYHQFIGFSHFFLFFDDPEDEDMRLVSDIPGVKVIPVTPQLRVQHPELESFTSKWYDKKIMARQEFHASVAMKWACDELDWLFHLDSDELFYCKSLDVQSVLRCVPEEVEQIVFGNYEGICEKIDAKNIFAEVQLFKRNIKFLSEAGIEVIPKYGPLKNFFSGYGNGKAASRCKKGVVADGCHRFFHSNGSPLKTLIHDESAVILHYFNCGFAQFKEKYNILGEYTDKYFDQFKIPFPVHLKAHEAVSSGDSGRMIASYREHHLFDEPELKEKLISENYLMRIDAIGQILNRLNQDSAMDSATMLKERTLVPKLVVARNEGE